jgi:hypothetical protein
MIKERTTMDFRLYMRGRIPPLKGKRGKGGVILKY